MNPITTGTPSEVCFGRTLGIELYRFPIIFVFLKQTTRKIIQFDIFGFFLDEDFSHGRISGKGDRIL